MIGPPSVRMLGGFVFLGLSIVPAAISSTVADGGLWLAHAVVLGSSSVRLWFGGGLSGVWWWVDNSLRLALAARVILFIESSGPLLRSPWLPGGASDVTKAVGAGLPMSMQRSLNLSL